MKSPPLVVCVVGSFAAGRVSTAASFGPGAAAFVGRAACPAGGTLAIAGVVTAATPASVAPLRKLRRALSGAVLIFASRGKIYELEMSLTVHGRQGTGLTCSGGRAFIFLLLAD